jgi:methyltransferase
MRAVVAAAAALIGATMVAESALSARNERRLRRQGAVEPPGDVYRAMQWAYPGGFAAMIAEGWWRGGPPRAWWAAGLAVFVAGKAVKYAAIASLGERWTFRVLVLPGAPLVTSGPYRVMNHPNYAGVVGEFIGAALGCRAPITGVASTLVFLDLLRRRIRTEEAWHRRHGSALANSKSEIEASAPGQSSPAS